jgi:hypothetical protein
VGYWAGNEPDILAPWLFVFGGCAHHTQYWTRWLVEHKYSADADGIPGNDDYGTMSAWLVFAALGLYPLSGAPFYIVGSPSLQVHRLRCAAQFAASMILRVVLRVETWLVWPSISCSDILKNNSLPEGGIGAGLAFCWRQRHCTFFDSGGSGGLGRGVRAVLLNQRRSPPCSHRSP